METMLLHEHIIFHDYCFKLVYTSTHSHATGQFVRLDIAQDVLRYYANPCRFPGQLTEHAS